MSINKMLGQIPVEVTGCEEGSDGYLNVRWLGTSNGYYGESVNIIVNGERQW